MAIIDILLPKMGESVAEAIITKLVVDAGADVEVDDPIVEIATDKVDSEVPAPEDGTLVECCANFFLFGQSMQCCAIGQSVSYV